MAQLTRKRYFILIAIAVGMSTLFVWFLCFSCYKLRGKYIVNSEAFAEVLSNDILNPTTVVLNNPLPLIVNSRIILTISSSLTIECIRSNNELCTIQLIPINSNYSNTFFDFTLNSSLAHVQFVNINFVSNKLVFNCNDDQFVCNNNIFINSSIFDGIDAQIIHNSICCGEYNAAVFITGALCGIIIAQLVFHLITFVDITLQDGSTANIILVLIFAIIFGFLAFKFMGFRAKQITSFIGSFMQHQALFIKDFHHNVMDIMQYFSVQNECDMYWIFGVIWIVLLVVFCVLFIDTNNINMQYGVFTNLCILISFFSLLLIMKKHWKYSQIISDVTSQRLHSVYFGFIYLY